MIDPDGARPPDDDGAVHVRLTRDGAQVYGADGRSAGSIRKGELVGVDGWSVALVEVASDTGPTSFVQGLLQARLVLDAGPSTGGHPRERALRPDPDRVVTVGRGPDCTIVIDDPKVSRRQFEITYRAALQDFWLQNVSQNGTRVDGLLITGSDGRRLVHGDAIAAGDSTLTFFNACRLPDLPANGAAQDPIDPPPEPARPQPRKKGKRSDATARRRRDAVAFIGLVLALVGLMGLLIWTLTSPGHQ